MKSLEDLVFGHIGVVLYGTEFIGLSASEFSNEKSAERLGIDRDWVIANVTRVEREGRVADIPETLLLVPKSSEVPSEPPPDSTPLPFEKSWILRKDAAAFRIAIDKFDLSTLDAPVEVSADGDLKLDKISFDGAVLKFAIIAKWSVVGRVLGSTVFDYSGRKKLPYEIRIRDTKWITIYSLEYIKLQARYRPKTRRRKRNRICFRIVYDVAGYSGTIVEECYNV